MGLTITIHKRVVSKLNAKIHGDNSQRRGSSVESSERINDGKQLARSASTSHAPRYYPTPSECKTHLKILKVFANLKKEVSNDDRFSKPLNAKTQIPEDSSLDDTATASGDGTWEAYVGQAAERFEKWWTSTAPKSEEGMLKIAKGPFLNNSGVSETLNQDTRTMKWTKANLPPVDVLMVLHSFMLNPRYFLRECLKYDMIPLWRAGFPWELIDQCIDETVYQYNAPEPSRRSWETTTKLKWYNTQTPLTAVKTQPSIFPLSLADAVIRQSAFIEVMQSISWLSSPSLDLTLGKLLSKYSHFFTIMAEHPNDIAVPTYAVDLAWHTHQLTPPSYYSYSISRTKGVFIDHDDKLGDDTLSDGFGFTKAAFEALTGGTEEYGECLCWRCMTVQVVRAENPEMEEGKVAIKARERIAGAQYRMLEGDFAAEVDRARKMGKGMPDQEAFLREYVWLYPDARPVLDVGRR